MSSDVSQTEAKTLRGLDLQLPPLPRTLPRVLGLLHEPGFVRPEDMTEVVQHDPGAVARLLKQINSAYYGLRRSITDVERAIRMMGATTAAGAVVSLGMLRMRELADGAASDCFTRLIRHSEATGFLVGDLLNQLNGEQPPSDAEENGIADAGFTEGLLHDFGKLVLLYNYPEKAVSLYQENVFEEYFAETDDRELEQLVFGCDHCEAGAFAGLELNFPSTLVDVMRHHHEPDEVSPEEESLSTARAVYAANRVTKAMGESLAGIHPCEATLDWQACARDPIWRHWNKEQEMDEEEEASEWSLFKQLRAKKEAVILFVDFFLDDADQEGLAQPLA